MLRVIGWLTFASGITAIAASGVAIALEFGTETPGTRAAFAQECVSAVQPAAQAPAPPQDAAPAPMLLPSTGSAGLLPQPVPAAALQECPTPPPEPTVAGPAIPSPEATATPAPSATPTAGPGIELPGDGGGGGGGGIDLPPGTVSY